MRILWLNWKDIKNPEAGGAEVFTHEVARRLVKIGHKVNLFSARFPNCRHNELLDGVQIIRNGGRFTVYREAKKYYIRNEEQFDLVIDEVNTRPFLSTKFVKKVPVIALIHQLAREFWFYETPFPVNYFGYYLLEDRWLKNYVKTMTLTVSNSTKEDLVNLGFQDVHVVPEGISVCPVESKAGKECSPTLVFVGRLKRAKLPDHAIEAFRIINRQMPDAKLWMIGDGYMRKDLQAYSSPNVIFFGHIDNSIKCNLVARANLILVPAVREGWGLVVTEANSVGTPAVAYNVPGLRDSIQHGVNGLLTDTNTPEELAHSALSLLQDKGLLDGYSKNANENSRQYSWDVTTAKFERKIMEIVS
jgi:glycosyltransferase involved in cell wall biosynthesis